MIPTGIAFTFISLLLGYGWVQLAASPHNRITFEGLVGFVFLKILFLVFLYAEVQVMRSVVDPDTLTISQDGLSIKNAKRTQSFPWAELGEPARIWESSGRGGSHYISLSRSSGEPLLIPGENYVASFDDVMAAIQDAKSASAALLRPHSDVSVGVVQFGHRGAPLQVQ